MATGDLTTLANLKAWLGINGVADDSLLTSLVSRVSAALQNNINRNFAVQSYTEVRSGAGSTRISVANYPLVSLVSVTVDGQTIPVLTNASFGTPGAVADDRGITLTGYRFTAGKRNVQLAYTAGYAQVPADIEQACIEWCAFLYRARDRIGHQSKSVQGETVSYVTGPMPSQVALVLKQYRKVVPT